MKFAMVYDAVYPWVKGGAEKRIYEVGKRLVKEGNEVHVFGVKWWNGADTIKNEGMVLHGVCKPMELYVHGRRSISEAIIFSIKLLPHLIKERFDVIDVSAFPYFSCFTAKLVSVLRGTPLVITWFEVWGDYWYEYLGWRGFFGRQVEYLISKLVSKQITISAMTKRNLGSLGVDGKNISIISLGVDLKKIASIPASGDICDIIFVGRLIREKNTDMLLEAISYLKDSMPDIKCHIIGDGPEKERLTELATGCRLQDNVRFCGFIKYDEIIARIKSSKVLVLPSSREGFGIVVIEAFACGTPVVTIKSKRNAASSLVAGGTGFVVNPDAKELGSAIRTIIVDSELRKKMSASAMSAALEYEWENKVRELSELYKGLI